MPAGKIWQKTEEASRFPYFLKFYSQPRRQFGTAINATVDATFQKEAIVSRRGQLRASPILNDIGNAIYEWRFDDTDTSVWRQMRIDAPIKRNGGLARQWRVECDDPARVPGGLAMDERRRRSGRAAIA